MPGEITRIYGHTHPSHALIMTGPSSFDRKALEYYGQVSSYLIERGEVYKFYRDN